MKLMLAIVICASAFIRLTEAVPQELLVLLCASVEPSERQACVSGELDVDQSLCDIAGCCYNETAEGAMRCTRPYGIDDCLGSPCKNGATCIDGINQYTCVCSPAFTGPNCETVIRTNGWKADDTDQCTCYWNKSRSDCACCLPGGGQCGEEHPKQCVEKNDWRGCGRPFAGRGLTLRPTGCSCYFDRRRTDCACCAEGACVCNREYPHQCARCGDASRCGYRYDHDKWTMFETGAPCFFDTSRNDCAVCVPGGAQCYYEYRHMCKEWGNSKRRCGYWLA